MPARCNTLQPDRREMGAIDAFAGVKVVDHLRSFRHYSDNPGAAGRNLLLLPAARFLLTEPQKPSNSAASGMPGRLAQLVEHLVYTERVGGSSPSPPTMFFSSLGASTREGRGFN